MFSSLSCHLEREKDYATDLLLSDVHGRAEIIFISFQILFTHSPIIC